MLESIKSFFYDTMVAPTEKPEGGVRRRDLRLAACALLLELAHADDEFTEDERAHLEAAIRRQFSLDHSQAARLMELAELERREAVDLWQFTRLIADNYSLGQKMVLAEIMWGLVFADGELASREDYLVRKISNLLGLQPGYLAEARKRSGEVEPGRDVD